MKKLIPLLSIPWVMVYAQTTINGGRIFKGILDASGATSTAPYRTGTGSPAARDSCGKAGESYFQTDAGAGQNVWVCTANGTPGTWAQLSGSGGGSGLSVASGTTTPAGSCSPGGLYVRTDVRQLYICSGLNVWQLASYGSDLAANRATNCATGQIFLAIDTGALSYCSVAGSPGTWQTIIGAALGVNLNGTGQGTFTGLNLVTAAGLNWQLVPNGSTLNITPQLDSAIVPSKLTGNTYAAGAKQSVLPGANGAGLNVGSGTLPLTATVGDIGIDPNGNLNWYNGAGWQLGTVADTGLPAGAPVIGNGANHVTAATTTGSGSFVLAATPTINNPVITSFVNSNHDHSTAANGGALSVSAFNGGIGASSTTCLHGDGTWGGCGGGSGGGGGGGGGFTASNLYTGSTSVTRSLNCYTVAVPATAFTVAATVGQVRLASMVAGWKFMGSTIDETTQLTSSNINGVTACIGTLASPCAYSSTPLALMQSAPNYIDDGGYFSAVKTSEDIYLQLTAAGGNLGNGSASNLTAGQITTTICGAE